jgi:hypothetical protein
MNEPIGMTPADIEDHVLGVWCLYMATETVKQAAYIMRNDYHHSSSYRIYLNDSIAILKYKKNRLIEVIKRKTLAHQCESPLHEHPLG